MTQNSPYKIWRMPLKLLDKKHLIAEHFHIHSILKDISASKNLNDPEVQRFVNHLGQLVDRHNSEINRMFELGVNHKSPLEGIENLKFKTESYTYTIEEMEKDLDVLEVRQKAMIAK